MEGQEPIEVKFTRAEYSAIEIQAKAEGKTVERWVLDAALKKGAENPLLANRRGLS